jgi:parallel beta-helix repeat protein
VLSNHATLASVECAWGGGVYGGPDGALIQGNLVEGNRTNSINTGSGAGLYQWYGSAHYQGNLVQRNHGGSAIYLGYSQSSFTDNRVVDNTAAGLQLSYSSGGGPTLVNNVFARNSNRTLDAFASAGSPLTATLLHNTLVGTGSGYGVYIESGYVNLLLTNTIVASHTWGITNTFPASSTVLADHTLFWANTYDGIQGSNSLNGVPAFSADGYHMLPGSAAIDVGVNAGVTTDIDNDPRPNGPGYDIGADEAQLRRVYLPLILRN